MIRAAKKLAQYTYLRDQGYVSEFMKLECRKPQVEETRWILSQDATTSSRGLRGLTEFCYYRQLSYICIWGVSAYLNMYVVHV